VTNVKLQNELFWKIFDGLPQARDGNLTIGDAPGLGIQIREEVVSKLCVA